MSDSWTLTLPCTRDEAVAAGEAEVDGAVLVATEEDEAAGRWRLDAYFDGEPDAATVAAVHALVPSAAGHEAVPAPLPAQDWVALSQAGLEPIREGRFVVPTSAYPAEAPAGGRACLIDAGQAFGTGHHATTAGCLAMLDALAGPYRRIVDLGTGTGLLAFAAQYRWPEAQVTATDIDPVAIAVTAENMAANGVAGVELVVADGTRDAGVEAGGPYDLVIANILAGPLIAMAPEVAVIAAPGATVVLAGLLDRQADEVVAAFHAAGCTERERLRRGDWTILRLQAAEMPTAPAVTDAHGRGDWALDA